MKRKGNVMSSCVAVVVMIGLGFAGFFANEPLEAKATSSLGEHVTKIFGGSNSSFALTSSSRVYAWGYNNKGQLGDGTLADNKAPKRIEFDGLASGESVLSLSAGHYHTLALTSYGNVYAWGLNDNGQLGDGTLTSSQTPKRISFDRLASGESVIALSAGMNDSFALTSTGNVYSWGFNGYGQLGNGTNTFEAIPSTPKRISFVGLASGESVIAISAGGVHALALTSSSHVYSWGYNNFGQLGDGTENENSTPKGALIGDLDSGESVVAIAAEECQSFAITSSGRMYSWGADCNDQLGDKQQSNVLIPKKISLGGLDSGELIVSISPGNSHTAIFTSYGNVYAWGRNNNGQLGDGTTNNNMSPKRVSFSGLDSGDSVVAISSGHYDTLALTSAGYVYACGGNQAGQLGDGTLIDRYTPTAALISPDYIFSANLFCYKTCSEYNEAYTALSSDYAALTPTQVANLANISSNDYPSVSPESGLDYSGLSKSVPTTTANKWAAIASLHNSSYQAIRTQDLNDERSIGLLTFVFVSAMAIWGALFIKKRKRKQVE